MCKLCVSYTRVTFQDHLCEILHREERFIWDIKVRKAKQSKHSSFRDEDNCNFILAANANGVIYRE